MLTTPHCKKTCHVTNHSVRPRTWTDDGVLKISGPTGDEIIGEWKRLHTEELNDLYCSPNVVRVIKSGRMRRAGHVARMGQRRVVYRVLVGKPEGKRPLLRPKRR